MPDEPTPTSQATTGPAPVDKPFADVTLILILVRHGMTSWNKIGRLQGHSDVPLSDEGREQARRLGKRFAAAWSSDHWRLLPGPPDAVFVSDLSRAIETAALSLETIQDVPTPSVTALLRERAFGDWEGLTASEARARFGPARSHSTEGEPHSAVWERMESALDDIWAAGTHGGMRNGVALVVGHGGSLRSFACLAAGLPAEAVRHFHLDNTAVSIIEMRGATARDNKGRILLWNDTAHLH